MNSSKYIKILINALITVLWSILLVYSLSGSALYEWARLASFVLFSIQLGLNWGKVLTVIRNRLHIENPGKVRSIIYNLFALGVIAWGLGTQLIYAFTVPVNAQENSTGTTQENSAVSGDSTADSSSGDVVTEEEYMGNLYCTACGKHCSLLSPRCGRGDQQAEEALSDYEELYAVVEATSDTIEASVSGSDTSSGSSSGDSLASDANLHAQLPVMGFYMAGTHYTVRMVSSRKQSGKSDMPE